MNTKRFVLANALSLLVCSSIYLALPYDLSTTTDVLGYPVHADFNVNRYFNLYYLIGLAFPLLAWAIYNRVWVRSGSAGASVHAAPAHNEIPEQRLEPVWQLLRVLFTGWAISVSAVALPQIGQKYFVLLTLSLTFVYTLLLYWLTRGPSQQDRLSFWNGCFTPLAVLCLPALSSISRVIETGGTGEATETVRRIEWFPLWLGIVVCAMLLTYAIPKMIGARSSGKLAQAEADLVLLVPGSLVVFFLRALVVGDLQSIDLFHSGETLSSAYLLERGYVPWRDVIFIHGLLADPLRSLLGMKLFGDTYWAAELGMGLLVEPLYWVSLYIMCVGLFRKNRAFVLIVSWFLPFAWKGLFLYTHVRFLLNPLMVLAFYSMVSHKQISAGVVFSLLALVQAVITPESIFNLPAFGITVLILELCHWDRERSFWRNLRLTSTVGVCGLAFIAGWFGYLAAHDALVGYLEYFANFGSGHRYTGGVPIDKYGVGYLVAAGNAPWAKNWSFRLSYDVAAYSPVVVIWLSIWIFLTKLRKDRRSLDPLHWTWVAMALFSVLYYQKFLSRTDLHSFHVFPLTYPILLVMAYKGLNWLDARVRWCAVKWAPHSISLGLLVVFAVSHSAHLFRMVTGLPTHFVASGHPNTKWSKVGYFELPQELDVEATDLRVFFNQYLEPDEKIFDFTNTPALYFFLLERLPATRFFHVSMAMHRRTQKLLIDELERDRPKLIAYFSRMGIWDDIPNMVRHYDVSRYILQHYSPFVTLNGTVFLQRRDLQLTPPDRSLFQGTLVVDSKTLPGVLHECAWGYSPHFGTADPVGYKTASTITASFESSGNLVKIRVPSQALTDSTSLVLRFESLHKDRFAIAASEAGLGVPAQTISFRSRTEKTVESTYVIPLSSCGQWLNFLTPQDRVTTMYMSHESQQTIRSVEFVN